MLEENPLLETEKSQGRIVTKIRKPVSEPTDDVLTTPFTSLAKGGCGVVHEELDVGATQEEGLVQEAVAITMVLLELDINPPMMEYANDNNPRI